MKNVLYMTGAVVNAGDFLIEKRSKALLKRFIPDIELTTEIRVNKNYSDRVDYLNSFDAILFPGGPIYQLSIYPAAIPFVNDLSQIKKPVFFIGGGLKTDVYGPKMTEQTRDFFLLGTRNGVPLGCRDVLTCRFLKQQGISDILMTGCPAWYSLKHIEKLDLNIHSRVNKKICVSEPANPSNIILLFKLLYSLRKEYNEHEIVLVIHREKKNELEMLLPRLKSELNISSVSISTSEEGFRVYDDCDFHVGFRVHAHIYNLSIRNVSFLINEDVRGMGMNLTLGLENINITRPVIKEKRLFNNWNLSKYLSESMSFDYVVKHVLDCINDAEMQNFRNFSIAYDKMRKCYEVMRSHIGQISDAIV